MDLGQRMLLAQPLRLLGRYSSQHLKPDLAAGLTVAVILLPQAIAFALIAGLPAQMGVYAAIVAAIGGALWGSSNQVHTGPTNAISLLVFSSLSALADPGDGSFILAAGLMAIMVGVLQIILGLLGLGLLINFVSHSVIVGFAGGAGFLIAIKQLGPLLGVPSGSGNVASTLSATWDGIANVHWVTLALGLGTILLLVAAKRISSRFPAALLVMGISCAAVFLLRLDEAGVAVLGALPRGLPPLAKLPILDLSLIGQLSVGALAVAAIGLVESTAVAKSIAVETGQRLDSNQEFVGQGMANLAAGLFSGYPCAGSFSRSAVNYAAGARTPVSAILSAGFVLAALFLLAPVAAFLPISALAGVLIVTGLGMIRYQEIVRIIRGAKEDAVILFATFLGTLFLPIEFAVLAGILLSFVFYILKTSVPKVESVLPDFRFRHFGPQANKPCCPQLGVIEIQGDLYFGAVTHVEKWIHRHRGASPGQRYLLLRMKGVNQCDFSGIHALESIVRLYREKGGDVFLTRVQKPVLRLMISTGFHRLLGRDHFLFRDNAIDYLFHRVLDPAICIYECPVRAFRECQNLPKQLVALEIPFAVEEKGLPVAEVEPSQLWSTLRGQSPPRLIDVREPKEFSGGHIPRAELIPLPKLEALSGRLNPKQDLVLVCRSGRRSYRAACYLRQKGFDHISILKGGMLGWERANLLEAIGDEIRPADSGTEA